MTSVVCLSDTHNRLHRIEVPYGDVLVHAGDATMMGTEEELATFNKELGKLPHPHKVVIAGNHDWLWEKEPELAKSLLTNATYLQDAEVTVAGVRIYGAPWTPWFHDWAFNAQRGAAIKAKWDLIPYGLDVLVTHGPPKNRHDRTARGGLFVGCEELLKAVREKKPRYHVFGHIHEGYGRSHGKDTTYVNAANCDEHYQPVNAPIVLEV